MAILIYNLTFSNLITLDVKLLLYPGAFNMTTGPAHWEFMLRSRCGRSFGVHVCVCIGLSYFIVELWITRCLWVESVLPGIRVPHM